MLLEGALLETHSTLAILKVKLITTYKKCILALCLPKSEYQNSCVQEFYIEAATQIKKHFPIGNLIIEMFQVLDPNTKHLEYPSHITLAQRFPNPDSKIHAAT